jgi:Tfp pilus assembly protein PilE
MTLVEVVIVAVLGVILSSALVGFSIYVAKLSKSTFSQLKFGHYAQQTIERIAKTVRYAKHIEVVDNGMRLLCTNDYGVTSAIYFSDDDHTTYTLANNRLYYIADINAAGGTTPRMIGRYVFPFRDKKIFAYKDRTSAVEINFRVGDPREPTRIFDRETGPGPQGMDVRTAVGPRNSYMD